MKKMGKGTRADSQSGDCAVTNRPRRVVPAVEDATWADVDLSDWIHESEPQLSLNLEFQRRSE